MGTHMLLICLARAAAGLMLLGLTFGALIRTARTCRRPARRVVLALAGVLTAGLLWIDIVIIWCLVEYGFLAILPIYVWGLAGFVVVLLLTLTRAALHRLPTARCIAPTKDESPTSRRRESTP